MLSPSGWWLAVTPIDLRCGIDRLLVQVTASLGRAPTDGGAYVFRNRAGTRIKVLCVKNTGQCALSEFRAGASGGSPRVMPGHE